MYLQSYLFALLAVIVVYTILYKAYLDIKIEDPDKEVTIFSIIAFRRYGLQTLLPLRTRANTEAERKLRRKANRILLVFYAGFTIIILLSIFGSH